MKSQQSSATGFTPQELFHGGQPAWFFKIPFPEDFKSHVGDWLEHKQSLANHCLVPPPTCCGRGCVGVGAQQCPLGLHALWGLRAARLVGGRPPGGWPATVVRGVWCQALSLPPAAIPLGRAAGPP